MTTHLQHQIDNLYIALEVLVLLNALLTGLILWLIWRHDKQLKQLPNIPAHTKNQPRGKHTAREAGLS